MTKKKYQPSPAIFFIFFLASAFCILPANSFAGAPFVETASIENHINLVPYAEYLPDPSGGRSMEEMLSSAQNENFKPLSQGIPLAFSGVTWLRFTLAPAETPLADGELLLDFGDHLPHGSILYTPKNDQQASSGPSVWQVRRADSGGMFKIPSAAKETPIAIYARIPGTPDIWFAPVLRTSQDAEKASDRMIYYLSLCLLGVAIAICLLRAFKDGGEWRLWIAVLAALILAQPLLRMPALPASFSYYIAAALYMLIPSLGLALMPHVARHLWNTSSTGRGIDKILAVLSILGGFLPLLMLAPGFAWIGRLLPLWPATAGVCALMSIIAMILKLPGSGRYFLCMLLLSAAGLLTLMAQTSNSPNNILINSPLWGGCIAALLLGIIPLRNSSTYKPEDVAPAAESGPALSLSEMLDTGEAPRTGVNMLNSFNQEDEDFLVGALQNQAPAHRKEVEINPDDHNLQHSEYASSSESAGNGQAQSQQPDESQEAFPGLNLHPSFHEDAPVGFEVGVPRPLNASRDKYTDIAEPTEFFSGPFSIFDEGMQTTFLSRDLSKKSHDQESFFNRIEAKTASGDDDSKAAPQAEQALPPEPATTEQPSPEQPVQAYPAQEQQAEPPLEENAAPADGGQNRLQIVPKTVQANDETPPSTVQTTEETVEAEAESALPVIEVTPDKPIEPEAVVASYPETVSPAEGEQPAQVVSAVEQPEVSETIPEEAGLTHTPEIQPVIAVQESAQPQETATESGSEPLPTQLPEPLAGEVDNTADETAAPQADLPLIEESSSPAEIMEAAVEAVSEEGQTPTEESSISAEKTSPASGAVLAEAQPVQPAEQEASQPLVEPSSLEDEQKITPLAPIVTTVQNNQPEPTERSLSAQAVDKKVVQPENADLALGDFALEETPPDVTNIPKPSAKTGLFNRIMQSSQKKAKAPRPVLPGSDSMYFSENASGRSDPSQLDPIALGKIEETLKVPLESLMRAVTELRNCSLPPLAKVQSEAIVKSGQALSGLISSLGQGSDEAVELIKSNTPREQDTIFDLQVVLREAHDAVVAKAERKGLSLSWFMPPHMPLLYRGKPSRLQDVLRLLLDSAIESTYRGSVQAAVRRLPDSIDPGHLVFSVTDTGETSPHLRRSTTALMKAWEMVISQGGTLSLDSTPNQGTVVSFTLRLAVPGKQVEHLLPLLNKAKLASAAPVAEPPSSTYLPARPLTILVADEQTTNRQLVSFFLNDLPYIVEEARSVQEAVDHYTENPAGAVIIDNSLPDLNLRETINKLHEIDASLNIPPVPVITLVQNPADADKAVLAGSQSAIRKPLSRSKIRDIFETLLPIPEEVLEALKPQAVPIISLDETKEDKTNKNAVPGKAEPKPVAQERMPEQEFSSEQPGKSNADYQELNEIQTAPEQRSVSKSIANAAKRFIRVRKKPADPDPEMEYAWEEKSSVGEPRPISKLGQSEMISSPVNEHLESNPVNALAASTSRTVKKNLDSAENYPWSTGDVSEPRPVQRKKPDLAKAAPHPEAVQAKPVTTPQYVHHGNEAKSAPIIEQERRTNPAIITRHRQESAQPQAMRHDPESTPRQVEQTRKAALPAEKSSSITPRQAASIPTANTPALDPEKGYSMADKPKIMRNSPLPPIPSAGEEIDPEVVHLIPGLLDNLEHALQDAYLGRDNSSFLAVSEACMRIAGTADAHGLRVIKGIASCVERAANANDLEAVNDLLAELARSTQANRKKLEAVYLSYTGHSV